MGFNAALVTVCWFLLPDSIRNWLFVLHGALVFPFILEMWMLGDTPATNVAGRDAVRAASQLDDPSALRVWLRAKHIVLTSFVGSIAALVAMVIAGLQQEYMTGAAIAITVVSLIVFAWAPGVAFKIARRRRDQLHDYLSDPEHG